MSKIIIIDMTKDECFKKRDVNSECHVLTKSGLLKIFITGKRRKGPETVASIYCAQTTKAISKMSECDVINGPT